MIYVGENKSTICKGDFHPAMLYKGNKKIAGYETKEFSGEGGVTLENCYNDKLHNAAIYGNSIQDGTPTPETPVEVQSVGELQSEGEYAGKYKISVTAKDKDSSTQMHTFDIYLDEPLRKIEDYEDYIDFEKGVIVRNIIKKVFNGTERWSEYGAGGSLWHPISTYVAASNKRLCLCNRLQENTWNFIWNNSKLQDGNLNVGIALKNDGINVTPYATLPTLDEWKAQLATWYEEGNPMIVWYVIPTTEEAVDLPDLPTFKGTTVYEIDTSVAATISGKYKKGEVE